MKYAKKRNPFTKYWLRRKWIRKFVADIKSYKQLSDDLVDYFVFDEYEKTKEGIWNRLKIVIP